MTLRRRDPLLTFARGLSWFFAIMLSIAAVLVAVAIPMVAFNNDRVLAELAKEGITAGPEVTAGIALLLTGILVFLALTVWFLRLLLRIIDTVGEGDPFIPENAERLQQMAWISLSTFLLSIPVGAVAIWVGNIVAEGGGRVDWELDFGGAVLLSVILFILARVFKQGAAMREDLEGTV